MVIPARLGHALPCAGGWEKVMQDHEKNLEDTSKTDRWQYAETLKTMGKPSVEYLLHALKVDGG